MSKAFFDIQYGWRKWKGNRFEWVLLLTGFSLFTGFLAVLLGLFSHINKDRPDWVASDDNLITVASKSITGETYPVSRYEIETLRNLPNVRQVASIYLRMSNIQVEDINIPRVNIAFYSKELPQVFELQTPFSLKSWDSGDVFISEDIAQKYNISGTDQTINLLDRPLLLKGTLDSEYSKLSGNKIDIWIPDNHLDLFVPEIVPVKEAYVKGEPQYYGFLQLTDGDTPINQMQELVSVSIQQAPKSDSVFVKNNNSIQIVEGVELDPISKNVLKIQMWTLTFLFIGFGFLVYSTYLNKLGEQLTKRNNEYKLKRSLGAQNKHFAISGFLENLPLIISFILLSILVSSAAMEAASNGPVFKSYFGDNISIEFSFWFIAVCVNLLLVAISIQFSISSVGSKNVFTRSEQGSQSKSQKIVRSTNFAIQLSIAITTTAFTFSIFLTEYRNNQITNVNDSVTEIRTKQTGKASIALSSQNMQGYFQESDSSIAISSTSFTALDNTNFEYSFNESNDSSKSPVSGTFVSSNYFDVLGIPALAREKLADNHVYINEAFAESLIDSSDSVNSINELFGKVLNIDYFPSNYSLTIAGVVKNAPHYGVNSERAVIYLNYSKLHALLATKIVPNFYSNDSDLNSSLNVINSWADENTLNVNEYRAIATLSKSIYSLNLGGRFLFLASGGMTVLILLLLALSLYYRMKNDVARDQRKYGTFLALGSSKIYIFKAINIEIFLVLLSSIPIALLLNTLIDVKISTFGSFNTLNISFLMSVLAITLLVKLFSTIALIKVFRTPIVTLIKVS